MADKIRILYIAASGNITGGGQVSLLNLIKRLNPRRFIPMVLCPEIGSLVDELRYLDISVEVVKIKSLRSLNLISFVKTLVKICGLIKERKIGILHSNAGSSRETICSALSARICGVPFIWHARVTVQQRSLILDRICAALSTRIIAISGAVRKRFSWLPDNKVDVIYNGVDLNRFTVQKSVKIIRREYKISGSTVVAGTIGRLDYWKGHRYFIESAAEVLRHVPEAVFFIVGQDGDTNRSKLGELAGRLGIRDKIIFTGYYEDIPLIISVFDVFVLASENEPFGRVLIEAMACGKPVVATNAGGVPEIVKDNGTGLLVPPKDSAAMSEAIVAILKDREKAVKMGRAGRRRAEELFDIDINVKKTEHVYEKLIRSYKNE
ncbi:MAG: glycosyltransferase family 4 protein [Elusimicrobia bacterium]|nr:glycosyltransferase family 4 protein [Elusimicrobiota bacterium]